MQYKLFAVIQQKSYTNKILAYVRCTITYNCSWLMPSINYLCIFVIWQKKKCNKNYNLFQMHVFIITIHTNLIYLEI